MIYKQRMLSWIAVLSWMILIYYFSSMSVLPGPDVVLGDFVFKKLAHIFVYAVLWLLVRRALDVSFTLHGAVNWMVFIICIVYAISDEYHQSLVPGRHPSVVDIGFDTLGMYLMFLKYSRFI